MAPAGQNPWWQAVKTIVGKEGYLKDLVTASVA